ncbi:MAG: hypothetical protein ABIH46_11570 [Chloroflexota bacterium]
MAHGYGLGIENVTNLDKSKPAVISQLDAFTVVLAIEKGGTCVETDVLMTSDNLHITGFTMMLCKPWKYRILKWLAERLL